MKVQQTKGQYTLTIPRAIALAKDWKKGTELEFLIDNLGQVILKQKK